jgi:molecular chaperone GrpE
MGDVKQEGNKIDADAAFADALASVEKRQKESVGGDAGGSADTVPLEVAPAEAESAPAPVAPAAAEPPPPPPRRSPQDAIIEALVKAKQEAVDALQQTQREAKDLLEARARIQAEFENYKKRVAKDKQEASFMTTQRLTRELLPVLDNLERALAHLDPSNMAPDMKNLVTGVTLVSKQFLAAIKGVGVMAFDSKGQPFDPARHEAVAQQPAPPGVSPGTVLEEHQRGFMLGETLLRPATVVVAGPPAAEEPPSA